MMGVRKNIEGAEPRKNIDAILQFKLIFEREELFVVFDKAIVVVRNRIWRIEKYKISGFYIL